MRSTYIRGLTSPPHPAAPSIKRESASCEGADNVDVARATSLLFPSIDVRGAGMTGDQARDVIAWATPAFAARRRFLSWS